VARDTSGRRIWDVIKLRLFSNLREIAGAKEVEVEGEQLSIKHALDRFADRFGGRARQCLFDRQGQLLPSVLLLVNGEATESGQETQVKSGDVVSVLLPTAGG
jgi:MoaD family protein